MKRGVLLATVMLGWAPIAFAQNGWTTRDGRPVAETQSCRAVGGLCGMLIVTSDDWKSKWETPAANVPRFNPQRVVVRGEHLSVLTFYTNPMLRGGQADLTCDIDIVRPDGSAVHQEGVAVHRGPVPDSSLVYLSPAVIDFVGEKGDAAGRWSVRVRLHDNLRRVTVPLATSFVLKQ